MQTSRRAYAVATIIALLIALTAAFYKFVVESPPESLRAIPLLGEINSDHAHTSLMIMVGDRPINFCDPKFMVKSPLVHFEENNCFVVHKHATGVTLQTFLPSIGVTLTSECLELPSAPSVCNEGVRRLRVVYNGTEIPVSELAYRELRNNDHILINYGAEDDLKLRFKYNQVPNIPTHINQPFLGSQ